jgi:RNA polymerase sigma factor (sigma-70 family)
MSEVRDVREYLEEAELFVRIRGGEQAAWGELVARCSPMLWRVARSFRFDEAACADIVQTTWLALAERGSTVREPRAVRAWLARTAHFACLHEVRRRRRVVPRDDTVGFDVIDLRPGPDQQVCEGDRDVRLWRAVGRLGDRDRLLLSLLTTVPALSYLEIAAAIGMPVGSIGPTRARCLLRLRRELEAEGVTSPADT